MRTHNPQLLPLFRSRGQALLLARLFLYPDRPMSAAELASSLGVDPATILRESQRLERAGLVKRERVGRQLILRPNTDSPYSRDLQSLLAKAFGPKSLLEQELAGVDGIEVAYIFGSWAERMLGVPGPAPNDVDVLIVGDPDRRRLAQVASIVSQETEREVNPTVVSPPAWQAADSGFLRSVKNGPLVPLEIESHE
jgi:DNA-binding transcriptional ArsR family regulator